MQDLYDYTTHGTVHIIINNNIGNAKAPRQVQQDRYSTNIARLIGAPVFHINADAPEEVDWCSRLAAEFRQKAGKDIFLDINGYRRHAGNEESVPEIDNPNLQAKIKLS
jgi:2-oxoglutarate decarboxylase